MPAFADNNPPEPQPTGTVNTGEQYDALCDGVQGPTSQADGFIYKFKITRVDNVDGSATFTIKLWGNLGLLVSSSPVVDCLWVDADGNGARSAGEGVTGALVEGLVITPDDSINGRGYFSVRVPGAANKTVCDQAYGVRSGQAVPTDPTAAEWRFRSTVLCSAPLPPIDIPEAGSVVLLGLTGALTGGALLTVRRRRLMPLPVSSRS
jgi:hypothetical protein